MVFPNSDVCFFGFTTQVAGSDGTMRAVYLKPLTPDNGKNGKFIAHFAREKTKWQVLESLSQKSADAKK